LEQRRTVKATPTNGAGSPVFPLHHQPQQRQHVLGHSAAGPVPPAIAGPPVLQQQQPQQLVGSTAQQQEEAAAMCHSGAGPIPPATAGPAVVGEIQQQQQWQQRCPPPPAPRPPKLAEAAGHLPPLHNDAFLSSDPDGAGPVPHSRADASVGPQVPMSTSTLAIKPCNLSSESVCPPGEFITDLPLLSDSEAPHLSTALRYMDAGDLGQCFQCVFRLGTEHTLLAVLRRLDSASDWLRLSEASAQYLTSLLVRILNKNPLSESAGEACRWLNGLLGCWPCDDLPLAVQDLPSLQVALFNRSAVTGEAGLQAATLYYGLFQAL